MPTSNHRKDGGRFDEMVEVFGPSESLSNSARLRLITYYAGLLACISVGDPNGGLIDVPMSLVLKNQMKMEASDVSLFRFVASVPLYLAFVFGLLRDKLNEGLHRDRQIMIVSSLCNVFAYACLMLVPASYATLMVANLITTCFFLMVLSAQSGMAASFAQRNSMSGPASAAWNFISYSTSATAFLMGGYVSLSTAGGSVDRSINAIYQVGIAASLVTAAVASMQPNGVPAVADIETKSRSRGIGMLLSHRPIYPALGVWLLWNFAPGAGTPLQYHMQNFLGASDVEWGLWNAVFTTAFLPAFVIYGFLSLHVRFRTIILASAIVAIPQFLPLLFVTTLHQATLFAFAAGLSGGMATSAYLDLLIRSCPIGYHGTVMMASSAIYFLSTRSGDVLGSYLYEISGGFEICIVLMTATYASIVVILFFVPRRIFV